MFITYSPTFFNNTYTKNKSGGSSTASPSQHDQCQKKIQRERERRRHGAEHGEGMGDEKGTHTKQIIRRQQHGQPQPARSVTTKTNSKKKVNDSGKAWEHVHGSTESTEQSAEKGGEGTHTKKNTRRQQHDYPQSARSATTTNKKTRVVRAGKHGSTDTEVRRRA